VALLLFQNNELRCHPETDNKDSKYLAVTRLETKLSLLIKLIIIIIIIFINCNWVVTQWQWLFYMYTNIYI